MHGMQRVTLHDKRRVVIQRDYSSGLGIKFCSTYPPDLVSKIDEDTWTKFICELNYEYESAEKITTRTVMETLLGCLSCYISRVCMRPSFYKRLDEIAEFFERTNREVFIPRGLYVKNPIEKGFRVMEIFLIYETYDIQEENYQNLPKAQSYVPRL